CGCYSGPAAGEGASHHSCVRQDSRDPVMAVAGEHQYLSILHDASDPQQPVWAACQLTTVDWRANAAVVPALLKAARHDPSAMVRVTCVRCLEQMDVKSADVTATLEVLKADKDSIVRGEVDYAPGKLKSTK